MAAELVKTTIKGVGSRGYVTFLAGEGDYVKGVVGLAKGLRKVKSAYPLLVAVLPDVPQEHRRMLVAQGCVVREIKPIYPPHNDTQFAHAYYVINYSKLRIWEFIEYERLIYLDGDIQVLDNIDHLFDLPKGGYFYAVMDCFCEASWSKTPQYNIGYCQQCPDKVQWPTAELLGPPPSIYFNAGFFAFEPSIPTFHDLLKTLNETRPTSFAEQDLLNGYFNDQLKVLPIEYNLVLAFLWRHPEKVELSKIKVVHYCAAGSKPWRYTGKEENMEREDIKMLVKRWWEIYEDPTLDYNPPKLETDMKPFIEEALSKAAAAAAAAPLNYVTAPSAA
ncbi:galactinol synthase 2-like [Silene latifolia]|uniref:galactinol synthase 2-like n=1 Tax=Silene latifolia TaxID=37657 RepID=UPI003D76C808